MDNKADKKLFQAMYRRWIYMLIAIGASMFLLSHPVFSFKEDQGIIYIRSFSMDKTTFYVTQTELKTGAEHITATMSVKGLYYCNWAMLLGCILCFFCFFSFLMKIKLPCLAKSWGQENKIIRVLFGSVLNFS